jgi:hypothetical protein
MRTERKGNICADNRQPGASEYHLREPNYPANSDQLNLPRTYGDPFSTMKKKRLALFNTANPHPTDGTSFARNSG